MPYQYRISMEFCKIFQRLCEEFYIILRTKIPDVIVEEHLYNDDGPALFISSSQNAREIKEICVDAETSIMGGRMMDIDVMDEKGVSVGRSDVGFPPRRCFICGRPAAVCTSRRLHSRQEICSYVEQMKAKIENRLESSIPNQQHK